LANQLGGCLLADAFDAWNVIDGVAH
jgi:hypothetical protein